MVIIRLVAATLAGLLVLGAVAAGPGSVPPRAQSQPPPAYGLRLFMLNAAREQLGTVAGLPATLHGIAYGAGEPGRYVVSGGPGLAADAAAAGIPVEVLDEDTTGKAYYFVDARPASAAASAGQFGAVLYAGASEILLAVDRASEQLMLETLPAQGISVALLPPEGLPVPQADPSAGATPEVAPSAPPGPDPFVQALLAQLDPGEISTLIAQISGSQPISTPGGSTTLSTRYTFASNARTVEAALFQQYAELGYSPAYSDWIYGDYSGRNVVADLRGETHPERVWLVGGHFDDTSDSPYAYAPGADDNASGTAATLAIAQILKGQRFADTIRFVGFGAEEQGHWGSIVYARALSNAGVQVMGYIDLDMIGWDSDDDRTIELHTGTGANSIALGQRFVDANARYGLGLRLELKQASASRFSDHSSFWDRSYPAFMAIENFFDDTLPRDRNPYYHKTGDILSRVDLDYVTRTAKAALALLADAAGLVTGTPTPTPTATSTPTPTSTPTTTPSPRPDACRELVLNGGFEEDAAWSFGPTATQADYTPLQQHSGARSVRMGIVPAGAAGSDGGAAAGPVQPGGERNLLGELAPDPASYSSVYQTISVPVNTAWVTLSFWRQGGSEGPGSDFQRGLLLRPGSYSLITTVFRELVTSGWQQFTFDLSPYRGQSVVLYFEVYNDDIAASPVVWMYLDDVSVQACEGWVPMNAGAWLPMLYRME